MMLASPRGAITYRNMTVAPAMNEVTIKWTKADALRVDQGLASRRWTSVRRRPRGAAAYRRSQPSDSAASDR
jgi:hypothetical protein